MKYSADLKTAQFTCVEPLKDKNNEMMKNNTLTVGVYYKHCSLMELKNQMMTEMKDCGQARLDPLIVQWVKDNKKLLGKLKCNEVLGVQIQNQDFSDIAYPTFELMDNEAKGFLRSLHTVQNIYGLRAMNYKKYYNKWSMHKQKYKSMKKRYSESD